MPDTPRPAPHAYIPPSAGSEHAWCAKDDCGDGPDGFIHAGPVNRALFNVGIWPVDLELRRAIQVARDFHQPEGDAGEYTRGQVELIMDMFGFGTDDRHDADDYRAAITAAIVDPG